MGFSTRQALAIGVAFALGACASHSNDPPASSTEAPQLRDDGLLAHSGASSPFDKAPASGAESQAGSAASNQNEWACLSRPEITACRGTNGTGRGKILWIRYRGRLLSRIASDVPLFARVSLAGKTDSFALSTDAAGAYILLTDGPARCGALEEKGASATPQAARCEEAPSRMKAIFTAVVNAPADAPWKVSLAFGVTVQPPGQRVATVDVDTGTPAYMLDLPARVEAPEGVEGKPE